MKPHHKPVTCVLITAVLCLLVVMASPAFAAGTEEAAGETDRYAAIALGQTAAKMGHPSASDQVSVALPGFPVTLNGMEFSNEYSRYPLLVYQDITYFPMTYYDCRLLGLSTSWSLDTGLSIDAQSEPLAAYRRELTPTKNDRTQTACLATGRITVNGTAIDNSTEPYPLLLFRDMTYFPLTWRFVVDEFGWTYHFDPAIGLSISNPSAPFTGTVEETVTDES